jgi:hypothetical protein
MAVFCLSILLVLYAAYFGSYVSTICEKKKCSRTFSEEFFLIQMHELASFALLSVNYFPAHACSLKQIHHDVFEGSFGPKGTNPPYFDPKCKVSYSLNTLTNTASVKHARFLLSISRKKWCTETKPWLRLRALRCRFQPGGNEMTLNRCAASNLRPTAL